MQKHTFHITGMHCKSCKMLIEDTIVEEIPRARATVQFHEKIVAIECDCDMDSSQLLATIGPKIAPHGYSLSLEKQQEKKDNEILWKAIPIGIVFLVVFFWLQRSGILDFGIGGQVTPTTGFIIGLIASVSSCLAIVGGLVLSLSAKMSQDAVSDTKNFLLFHIGRIGGFALLGGLLGILGQAIGINPTITGLLGILVALVMILLGIDLLGIFKNAKLTLPTGIFQIFRTMEHTPLTPLIIGAGTFFLPCGFTQSMQVAALSSGSFLGGGLIMLAFSLGTFPMLALLSFGSTGFATSRHAGLFFKSAGVVVLGLGIFSLLTGLVGLGIIDPIFVL